MPTGQPVAASATRRNATLYPSLTLRRVFGVLFQPVSREAVLMQFGNDAVANVTQVYLSLLDWPTGVIDFSLQPGDYLTTGGKDYHVVGMGAFSANHIEVYLGVPIA